MRIIGGFSKAEVYCLKWVLILSSRDPISRQRFLLLDSPLSATISNHTDFVLS